MNYKLKVTLLFGFIMSSLVLLAPLIDESNLTGKQVASVKHTNFSHLTEHVSDIKKVGCRKIPDVLIIGFEKCGTVSLKHFLGVHPKIFNTDSRINNRFFNPDNNQSLADFTKDMPCTPDGKLRLEKIATPGLPKLVSEYNPDVNLIAIVKEPVERAMSHFVHLKTNGILESNASDFEEFVTVSFRNKDYKSPVFHFSFYVERLKRWLDVFSIDRILFLDGDTFVRNPVTELRKAEVFLGLEASITKNDFYFSEEKRFYCIKSLGDKGCMGRRKGRPHPVMENDTRIMLQEFFRPYNERFFKTIGQRFPWNYSSKVDSYN